jgi:hypothetical protein
VPLPPRDNPPDAACTFCGRGRAETGRMVEGPARDLYICRNCADLLQHLFEQIARDGGPSAAPPGRGRPRIALRRRIVLASRLFVALLLGR